MKKAIIVFSLIFLTATFIQAQLVKSIALKSGIVWANQDWEWMNVSDNGIYNYNTGLHFALDAEFLHHRFLSIISEAGYIEKGMSLEHEVTHVDLPEGTGEMKTFNTNFNYLYLSPLLKARIEFGKFIPYAFIGPRADFYLSYRSDLNYDEIEENMNKVIFGMIYGLGLEYILGPVGIAMIYSQQIDFMPTLENTPPHGAGLEKIINNAFILDLGIKYYFRKK